MHAWDRLHRKFPGQDIGALGVLGERLVTRDREPPPTRTCAGESFNAIVLTVRKNGKVANPKPNAPLLIRIVRYPFGLPTVRGRRTKTREAVPWADLQRARWVSAMVSLRSDRAPVAFPNPVKEYARSLERRLRPSAAAWLAGSLLAHRGSAADSGTTEGGDV